nr:hypothetical protein [Tanacetum cinerariifolium]
LFYLDEEASFDATAIIRLLHALHPMFLALGRLLEEIHVPLAHLERKRTILRTYTKSLDDLCIQCVDAVTGIKQHRRDLYGDDVGNFTTTSGRGRLKDDLESSTWRQRQDF